MANHTIHKPNGKKERRGKSIAKNKTGNSAEITPIIITQIGAIFPLSLLKVKPVRYFFYLGCPSALVWLK